MPAKKRRATPVDATVEPDLTDVPMTPMMEVLKQVGTAARDLRGVTAALETLVIDASEGAWAEGQQVGHMLRVQGRRFSDRTHFGTRLSRRDIDTSESWRNRTSGPIDEQPVPDYLDDPELEKVAALARALAESIATIEAKRARQYPGLHKRSLEAIEARRLAKAG